MKVYIKPLIQNLIRAIAPPKVLTDLPTSPISEQFGLERGMPIDRFYIEQYLSDNAHFIKGRVVEIAENTYTLKFGKNVEKSEILHVDANDKSATIIADLSNPHSIPENVADTFICTQTLNFIYDVKKAIHGIHRILKPGGKAIITVAGLSQISRFDMDRWGDYWRFTDKSLKKLLGECFDEEDIEIVTFGNVHSATMFLHGLAIEEVDKEKIAVKDENYQVLLGAIVTKKAPVAQSFLSTNFDKMLTTLAFFLIYPMQSKLKVYHTKIEQTVGAVAEMTNELEALITL